MSSMAKSNAARFAAMKAAEINAKLMAKGIPIKQEVLPVKQKMGLKEQATKVVHNSEIEINGLSNRGLIMRSSIQDQIGQWSGTTITTRGRYISEEMKSDIIKKMERPLFINITAVNKDWDSSMKKAIHYVLAVLGLRKVPPGSRGFPLDQYPEPTLLKLCERDLEESTVPFVERVPCGMGDQPLPWNIKQEIEGPNGAFIEHIVQTTNAKIVQRGILSGYLEIETGKELREPLFIQINHSTLEGLVEAKSLVDSLLTTVHQKIREKRKNTPFQKTFGVPTSQSATDNPARNEVVYPMQMPGGLALAQTSRKLSLQTNLASQSRDQGLQSREHVQQSRNHAAQSRDHAAQSRDHGAQSRDHGAHFQKPLSQGSHNSQIGNDSNANAGKGGYQRNFMNHVLTLKNNDERNKDSFRMPERVQVQPKRRFQENFDSAKKRKEDEKHMMPPPPPKPTPTPTTPISAGNVSEWILETANATESSSRRSRDRGRGKYNKTVVCAYSDSDDDDED